MTELVNDFAFNSSPEATEQMSERTVSEKEILDANSWVSKPCRERLTQALVNGISEFIDGDVEECRASCSQPLQVIEDPPYGRHERGR